MARVYLGDQMVWTEAPEPAADGSILTLALTSNLSVTICAIPTDQHGVSVDWGDGSAPDTNWINAATGNQISHTYSSAGTYTVTLTAAKDVTWKPGSLFGLNILNQADKSNTSPELTAVYLDDAVTEIFALAFLNCTSLSQIELGVPTIYNNAFRGCVGLQKVWLRESVDTITVSETTSSGSVTERNGPFKDCSSSLVIYCEADSKPSGWNDYWNVYTGTDTRLSVVWGQKTRPW